MKRLTKYRIALLIAALIIFAGMFFCAVWFVSLGLPDLVASAAVVIAGFLLLWFARGAVGEWFFGVPLDKK